MLPAGARLRNSTEFTATLRAGRRRTAAGDTGPALLVSSVAACADGDGTPRAGFIVSRAVGGAVVRNRVRRRLRHLVATRLASLPSGSRLVVRALPAAATASFAQLGHALDASLTAPAPTTSRRR